MSQLKYYYLKIKYRLNNLRGGWDYFLLLVTVLNIYGLGSALMRGDLTSALINGIFLALCLRSLVY